LGLLELLAVVVLESLDSLARFSLAFGSGRKQ